MNSQVETYQKMYRTMYRENTFVNSTKEGVARVRQGGFAYLTDEPYLDYYNQKSPCNTMMVKNLLEAKSYGIGLQRRSDLTNPFSVAILKVKVNYVARKLYRIMQIFFIENAATHRNGDFQTSPELLKPCPPDKKPAKTTAGTGHRFQPFLQNSELLENTEKYQANDPQFRFLPCVVP